MRRCFTGKLNNVLAQIRLQRFDSFGFQSGIEMNLFSCHALTLYRQAGISFASETTNYRVCFACITRPMNLGACFFSVRFELFEITIEMKQRFVFDGACLRAQVFPVRQTFGCFESALAKKRGRFAQRSAQLRVG